MTVKPEYIELLSKNVHCKKKFKHFMGSEIPLLEVFVQCVNVKEQSQLAFVGGI